MHARIRRRSTERKVPPAVYSFRDLSGYSRRDRLTIRAADILFFNLMRLICRTVKWEARGIEHLDRIIASGHRVIFTSWHMCIFTATWFWRNRGIVVMSSRSRDAEYTARVIARLGYGTVRGSSSRGGLRALTEMVECLENQIDVGFTIDGPRGPACVAKPGAVTLARHTGHAILPFHISPRRFIALPSWDRLEIPLPFSRVIVLVGEPIYVARHADRDAVREAQSKLQRSLESLKLEAETQSKAWP